MKRLTVSAAPVCSAFLIGILCAIGALVGPTPVPAQEAEAAPSQLTITSIAVEPAKPGPDTLCRLTVKIKNDGEQIASQFGFDVKLNGQGLAVYGNQLFMFPVPAKGEEEIQLYNFWTTETSRPDMPAGGKYQVEVTLREAQWMSITMEEEEGEEIETWRPLGAAEGLPVSTRLTLETAAAKPAG